MKPAIIVPFHDGSWLVNVAGNLRRQAVEGVSVVLAVNGKAKDIELPWPTVASAESHADAVNAGADWCRATGHTHAVCLDSDDYYGPAYVAQALDALRGADYCGKRSIFTWMGDGLHLFDRPGGKFMGGTLAFRVDRFVPMPAVHQDDSEWCRAMEASHAVGVDTGPGQYCYVRHGANAHWRANDTFVRRALGPSRFFPGALISDVGGDPGISLMRPPPSDAEIFEAM